MNDELKKKNWIIYIQCKQYIQRKFCNIHHEFYMLLYRKNINSDILIFDKMFQWCALASNWKLWRQQEVLWTLFSVLEQALIIISWISCAASSNGGSASPTQNWEATFKQFWFRFRNRSTTASSNGADAIIVRLLKIFKSFIINLKLAIPPFAQLIQENKTNFKTTLFVFHFSTILPDKMTLLLIV